MSESLTIGALFLSGLISATLLPGGSEALFAWKLVESPHNPWLLWLAVTSGNTLGGFITYAMGWGAGHLYSTEQFNKPYQLKATSWLQRYGVWALLLSWLPLVGDPLCLIAGWLRTHWLLSLLCICVGKALRYLLLMGVF